MATQLTSDQRLSALEQKVFGRDNADGFAAVKFPPARKPTDVMDADVQALNAALKSSFAVKYPEVGSHITPGSQAQRMALSFYPAGIAQARAQEKFEEAAALAGDDYKAFSYENPGQGDSVYQSLISGKPLTDYYGR